MNAALTRQLALLQARLQALEIGQEQLRDYAALQELARLRAETVERIRRHHASGETPANPLEHVREELTKWQRWLELARESLAPALAAAVDLPTTPSRLQLEERLRSVSELQKELPTCLGNLRAALDKGLLDSAGSLPAELPEIARLAGQPLPNDAGSWAELVQGKGPLHERITERFEQNAKEIPKLLAEHDRHRAAVDEALQAAKEGNFHRALTTLPEVRFGDLRYAEVRTVTEQQQRTLTEATESLVRARQSAQERDTLVKSFRPFSVLLGWRLCRTESRGTSELGALGDELQAQAARVPDSEFAREASALASKLEQHLERRQTSRRRFKFAFLRRLTVVITAATLLALGLTHLILLQRTRLEVEWRIEGQPLADVKLAPRQKCWLLAIHGIEKPACRLALCL